MIPINDSIAIGKWVLQHESTTLAAAAERLGIQFEKAVQAIVSVNGKVVTTGLGKSGHVATKVAATLSSTGTPSFFLHPSEALHGDLGMLTNSDIVLAFAQGGETTETLAVCKFARRLPVPVICVTGHLQSSLAKLSDIVLDSSVETEACPHNLAPTASTALAMAIGDALAMATMSIRGFDADAFAAVHPGGSLGKKLLTVKDVMRPITSLKTVVPKDNFFSLMESMANPNYGIVAVIEANQTHRLLGCVTDGDIRRALNKYRGEALNKSVDELMHTSPRTISLKPLAMDAFKIMESSKITSLFVVDERQQLVGLLRMHDLLDRQII